MIGFLYILKSTPIKSYYIGSTLNPTGRLLQHNLGKVTATKNKGPWEIVFLQKYSTIKEARQIEYKLKKFKSRIIIEKIIHDNKIIIKLQ